MAVILPNRNPSTLAEHDRSFYAPSRPVQEQDRQQDDSEQDQK